MQKENITEALEENISSANRLFSETFSMMTENYRKQMEFSYDLFNNFLNPLKIGTGKSGIGTELFSSGAELVQKITEPSRKMMSSFMNLHSRKPFGKQDGEGVTDFILNAYKLQMKQISDINKKFFKTFNETFKTTNVDFDSLYNAFRKSTEENLRMAEDGLSKAITNYIAISSQSSKDFQKMLETANKQIEDLVKNNISLWSDLLQDTKIESKRNTGKTKRK